jgi:hypothetical protein
MITSFEDGDNFPYEGLDVLCSALATLPALESIGIYAQLEDRSDLTAPEILTELLRVPTLRSVCFHNFSFTPAIANALRPTTTTLQDLAHFFVHTFDSFDSFDSFIMVVPVKRSPRIDSFVLQRSYVIITSERTY